MSQLRKPTVVISVILALACIVLSVLAYRLVIMGRYVQEQTLPSTALTPFPTLRATPNPSLIKLPVQDPSAILGVDANNPSNDYPGIPWVRLGYVSCGSGNLQGQTLRNVIQNYHRQNIRVLLTYCQRGDNADLYNLTPLEDVATANADAVQCGNEEMKQDASVSFLYVQPDHFARFYDLCSREVHAVRSGIPVLLGSLDPHVGGVDYQPLVDQANYLDQMQDAMNTEVHPGGNWDWHTQILGLIDSWHNGYPDSSVNSLAGLFSFWADKFQVDLNSGQLGKHLWVVEGTGCFKGCGIDASNPAQVAISHILTLTTDVQTSMQYKVPFFYFSGIDFFDQGIVWPIGILDSNGHPKPLRQDLPMGARKLILSCPGNKSVTVQDQEQLLAQMYTHCSLPSDYVNTLTS